MLPPSGGGGIDLELLEQFLAQMQAGTQPQMPPQMQQGGQSGLMPTGGMPPSPMGAPQFPQMVAENPQGWGNAPPAPAAALSNAMPTAGESAASFLRQQGHIGERVAPVASAVLDYGPELAKGYMGQIDRSAQALSDATNDPSLANVTNAGVQTAMTFGRPIAAGGMFGAGMLEGARRDFAPDIFGSADAQSLNRSQRRDQEMRDRQAAREREAELARIKAQSEAKRAEEDAAAAREAESEKKRLERERQAAEQDEYNRAVERSELAFGHEMGRNKQFTDSGSYTKQIADKVGGLAPFLGGALGGGVAGAFGRKLFGQAVGGAAGGIAATSAPLFEDAYFTPVDNPKRSAYQSRGMELPPGHPRKQEFLDYAASMPEANPVRTEAQRQLYNPVRLGLSAAEGALAGPFFGEPGSAVNRMLRGVGERTAMPSAPMGPPRLPPRAVVGKDGVTRYKDPRTGHWASPPG